MREEDRFSAPYTIPSSCGTYNTDHLPPIQGIPQKYDRKDDQVVGFKMAQTFPEIAALKANYNMNQKKKSLLEKRKIIASDLCSFFAAMGMILMILDNEFIMNSVYDLGSSGSYVVKSLCTLSTFFLLIFVICVKVLSYQLNDGRDNITFLKVFLTILELLLYSIHPIPGEFTFKWKITPIHATESITVVYRVDVVLSLFMVSRFYLFLQTYLLHLNMFDDKFNFIGKMNGVDFNIYFKLKTLTTFYPARVLLVFNSVWLITASWYLRLTERLFDSAFNDMQNSMWCTIVTFLTVGYGDLYPISVLGRTIAMFTGFVGIASSSLLITVLAQTLKLTMAEEFVQNYISTNTNKHKIRNSAAKIIQKAWLSYKYRKIQKATKSSLNRGKLENNVRKFKRLKYERKKDKFENDNSIEAKQRNICEVQKTMLETITDILRHQETCIEKINSLEKTINSLKHQPSLSTRV